MLNSLKNFHANITNPSTLALVFTICAALLASAGYVIGAFKNAESALELQESKNNHEIAIATRQLEHDLIIKALNARDKNEAISALRFYYDVGIIQTPELEQKLKSFLENADANDIPSLVLPSEEKTEVLGITIVGKKDSKTGFTSQVITVRDPVKWRRPAVYILTVCELKPSECLVIDDAYCPKPLDYTRNPCVGADEDSWVLPGETDLSLRQLKFTYNRELKENQTLKVWKYEMPAIE